MARHISKYERETIILYNEEEKTAIVETSRKSLITRLDKYCEESDEIKVIKENGPFKTYQFPKKWVKITMPRQYSEEEREIMKQRGKEMYGKYLKKREENN